jgi:5-oxoprolinase (ATP-hydrolysing) subunit A
MTLRLDINADVGEHDGPPSSSALALLDVITSANIACGWHAGDATSMRHTLVHCAALGVQVGAHPSYPDRDGFGRRVIPLTAGEVTDAVAHQLEALCALAEAERAKVTHVKPHGALYNVACVDAAVADAVVRGVTLVGCATALYAPGDSELAASARAAGLRVVAEGFLDRAYEDDGRLTPREVPGAVLHDADAARARAVAWARTGQVVARSGRTLRLPLETLCVHGDTPDAVTIASRVREGLEASGVSVRPALAP